MTDWARVARTVVAGASSLEVGILGSRAPVARHASDESGALIIALDEVAPQCADLVVPGEWGPVVDAVASDVSSVAHSGRLRGRVALSGRARVMRQPVCQELADHLGLAPVRPVVQLMPDTVRLEWFVERGRSAVEPVEVAVEDYVAASVDPLAGWQDDWLLHLDRHHAEELRQLVERQVQPVATLRPVLADAEGIVLREYVGACRRDLRVRFPSPVRCRCSATAALRALVAVSARG